MALRALGMYPEGRRCAEARRATTKELAVGTAMHSCRCAFEAIEPRVMLATASFVGAVADPTSLTVGAGDITFATGSRGAVAATSVLNTESRPGGVLRVTYGIPAYDAAWGATD